MFPGPRSWMMAACPQLNLVGVLERGIGKGAVWALRGLVRGLHARTGQRVPTRRDAVPELGGPAERRRELRRDDGMPREDDERVTVGRAKLPSFVGRDVQS